MATSNPQLSNALASLHDIVIPDPVGWWPPSIGLVGLLVGVGGLTIGLIWYYLTQRKQNQYRRQAKEVFDQVIAEAGTPQQKLLLANKLLKQVAITNYGRRQVASLRGEAWVKFLKSTALHIDQPKQLQIHLEAAYQPHIEFNDIEIDETLQYAQSWIKGHHK